MYGSGPHRPIPRGRPDALSPAESVPAAMEGRAAPAAAVRKATAKNGESIDRDLVLSMSEAETNNTGDSPVPRAGGEQSRGAGQLQRTALKPRLAALLLFFFLLPAAVAGYWAFLHRSSGNTPTLPSSTGQWLAAALILLYLAAVTLAGVLMRRQAHLLAANQALNEKLKRQIAETQKIRGEFDKYFELGLDLFCIAGKDGYFKRVNPAWEKALGYSAEELLSQPYLEFVHPDDRTATTQQATKQVEGSNVTSFANRYKHKDGTYRWLAWAATAVTEEGMIYAVARDVTELRDAEQALRRSEEHYRLLFESNPHPMWVYNLASLAIVDVNAAAIQNYGYTREEFLTRTIKDMRPAEDVPAVMESVAKSRGEMVNLGEWRHRKKDGTLIDVEITSHPLLFGGQEARLVVATDITRRKQAQTAVRQSEALFRSLVADVRDYAIFLLDPQGRVASWNAGAERIKGYRSTEILGRSFSRFFTAEDLLRDLPAKKLKEAETKGRAGDEGWRVRKDGSRFWANAVITALRDDSGTLIGFSKITRDVTERKKTQEALILAKEEAERSNRFKDQFLSTMSHELRTPLNAVVGFSDLLTEEHYGPLNERQKRYVNHIHTGGRHLLRLINDILDLSKIEAGRLQLVIEDVPVRTAMAEVLDTMRALADKKSQTLVENSTAELCVRADATRFRQMLMNLVGNAVKFTPEGGRIEVAARAMGESARIDIRDNGPGIPAEEQQRIFEAFYRLGRSEKAVEGTGLGLAITRRLVELHGGHLGIESKPGEGSCFFFTLPVAEQPKAAAGESAGKRREDGATPTILVIEDDPRAAHLLQSQLTSAGYEVVLCGHSEEALQAAAELQPSAITLDIIMKPISGWELLPSLKSDARTAAIPVIVVTIVDQPNTGTLLGADEYIVKPVQKITLLAAVERCLNRRGREAEASQILVVEDDAATREFIAELLAKNSYRVATARDGAEARAQVASAIPELVILDLVLPEVSGFELLTEWRTSTLTADLPIFVLTSKDLSVEEKEHIRAHKGALFQKQKPWQDELLRHLQRVVRANGANTR